MATKQDSRQIVNRAVLGGAGGTNDTSGGSGGAGGVNTSTGGSGGSGVILIDEYYQ